jgi:hypothetical protein
MYIWSKAIAIALVATLVGFGATAIQAKDHNHKNQSCQPRAEGCPAPVIQQPMVESSCCPIPEVPTRCAPPPQPGCCGVVDNSKDKDYDDAHKAALKAHHEAQEACQKRQKAIAKAQHEIGEKVAEEQRRIDRANDQFNHELSELQDANAKYDALFAGSSSDAVAEAPVTQPASLPEP